MAGHFSYLIFFCSSSSLASHLRHCLLLGAFLASKPFPGQICWRMKLGPAARRWSWTVRLSFKSSSGSSQLSYLAFRSKLLDPSEAVSSILYFSELSVLWVHQVDFDCPRKKFLFEVFLSSGGETVCIGGGLNATTPSRRFELEQFIENHYVSIKFSSENKQKNLNQVLDRGWLLFDYLNVSFTEAETVSKESGKDEDENQMMRNGESVLFDKCSFWWEVHSPLSLF